jgi:hypothetical protein
VSRPKTAIVALSYALAAAPACAATAEREPPPTTPATVAAATSTPPPSQPPRPATERDAPPPAEEPPARDSAESGSATDTTSPCEQAPWLGGVAADRGSSTEELEAAVASAAAQHWPEAELLAPVFTGHARGSRPLGFSVTLPADRCFRLLGAPEPPGPVHLDLTIARGSEVLWSNEDRGAEDLAQIVESPVELPPRCHCTGQTAERARLTVRFGSTGRRPVVRPGQRSPAPRQPVAVGVYAFPKRRRGP